MSSRMLVAARYLFVLIIGCCLLLSGCEKPQAGQPDVQVNSAIASPEKRQLFYNDGKLLWDGEVIPGQWGTINHAGDWTPNGSGKMYYCEGPLYYEGQMQMGWRDGRGAYYSLDGRLLYDGFWKNDSPLAADFDNGHHVLYYVDGSTIFYDGEWKNGLRDGQGASYYENGSVEHEGGYKNGLRSGEGKYYTRDGTLVYEGFFKKGVPFGHGEMKEEGRWIEMSEQYEIDYPAVLGSFIQKLMGDE